jgi:hypothetical protein
LWLTAAIVAGLVRAGITDSLLHRLVGIFQIVLISLFLSFAVELAVGYLAKWGRRPGGGERGRAQGTSLDWVGGSTAQAGEPGCGR